VLHNVTRQNSASNFFFLFLKIKTTHHTNDECQMFKNNQDLLTENAINVTGILLVLRLLLVKYRNPAIWEKINHMEAHLDKRIGTSIWKDREDNIVNVSFT